MALDQLTRAGHFNARAGADHLPDALAALTQQGVIKTYIEITDADGLRR